MNVLLLSVPRSGSTYFSKLITHGMQFNHVYYDPVDAWQYPTDTAYQQNLILDTIEDNARGNSVFIRHNCHFVGLDPDIKTRFEKLFIDKFYIIKLIRDRDMFDVTLSHIYAMLTGVVHDCLYSDLPVIDISHDVFLEQLSVCNRRLTNLLKFEAYDEIIYQSWLTTNSIDNVSLTKLTLSTDTLHNIDITPNTDKQTKIKNYNELSELYKSL